MSAMEIRDRLLKRGEDLFNAPPVKVDFFKNSKSIDAKDVANAAAANVLLNDLDRYPHAFVLGCIMDRQIRTERAWIIPYSIAKTLEDFSFATLVKLSLDDVRQCMKKSHSRHRYDMSESFFLAIRRIESCYGGDASRIWKGRPSSADVVYRFLEFHGVGPKIATMAANILAREFKIPFSDYVSVDISADVHVRRVFKRTGLCDSGTDNNLTIYKARALHPEFPGIFDFPAWEIGKNWCWRTHRKCPECCLSDICPKLPD